MTLQATLYTKPGCHLCEDTRAHLDRLRRRHPHDLILVDITRDPDLLVEYGQRIPVLVIDGHEYDAPLLPAILEHALRRGAAAASVQPTARPRARGAGADTQSAR